MTTIINIKETLYSLSQATYISVVGKRLQIHYEFIIKNISYNTEREALEELANIDSVLSGADDDLWYSLGNERYHLGKASSIQKKSTTIHSLQIFFTDSIKTIDFGSDMALRNDKYDAIKEIAMLSERDTENKLWIENSENDTETSISYKDINVNSLYLTGT